MINITRSLKRTSTVGLLAAACVLPFCSPVLAGGVDEPWMLDDLKGQLESLNNRVGKLERTYVQKGTELLWAKLSGQVNRAMLWAGNGHDRDYFNVDNDAGGSSRFRLEAGKDFNQDVSVGTIIEVGASPNGISTITFKKKTDAFALTGRKADLFFASKTYGTMFLGKNFPASSFAGSSDLSGLDSSVLGSSPDGFGGNLNFQKSFGGVSYPLFTVDDSMENFGPGRSNRMRYDTPAFNGFTFSVAAMDGFGFKKSGDWDAALSYAQEINKIKIAAAMGYAKLQRSTPAKDKDPAVNPNDHAWMGSASILFPQGWNFTVAGSRVHEDHGADPDRNTYKTWYGKVGYLFNWCQWGQTALGVDYGHTRDYLFFKDVVVSAGEIPNKITYQGLPSRSRAIGAGIVQNIDSIATELYVGYHNFKVSGMSDVIVNGTSYNPNPDSVNVGMIGALIKM